MSISGIIGAIAMVALACMAVLFPITIAADISVLFFLGVSGVLGYILGEWIEDAIRGDQ